MKKYTVKDFLKLNSPCYGCGGNINVYIFASSPGISDARLKITVSRAGYSAFLSTTYYDRLRILIEPRTNKFITNNEQNFISYLKTHNLSLIVECDVCMTTMYSGLLRFNHVGGYIEPVGVDAQYIVLQDRHNKYIINSLFLANKTTVSILSLKRGGVTSITNLDLPLLPHYKFRDQEHFMSKLRTYMTFS